MPDPRPTPPQAENRPIAAVMTTGPRTCSPFSTVVEAALIFRETGLSAVAVVDAGTPVGLLTERDVALAVIDRPDLGGVTVESIMSRDPVAIPASTTIAAARAHFAAAKGQLLLIVDAADQLLGIVARADLPPKTAASKADRRSVRPALADQGTGRWAWARPKAFYNLIRTTMTEWSEDKVPRLGAALAFYSVLSVAPLLLIAISVAALVFGEAAASGELVAQIEGMVGTEGAKATQEMLKNAHKPGAGSFAAIVGSVALLFAASGVFGQLQDAMNTIWEVQPKPGRGVMGFVKDRFLSFTMVLGTGFLLLTSLVLSASLAAVFALVRDLAPSLRPVLAFGDTFISAVVVILLFALIFKLLPDARIAWRDVWVGAGLTTVLFLIGKALIGAYLGRSSYGSAYGAAGSLVVLLVWIYYSSQILFFGAEFTQVYANRFGSQIRPAANAEAVTERTREQQGIPRAS